MRTLTALLFTAVLASCAKEPREVTYGATCDRCTITYRYGGGETASVLLDTYRWETEPDSLKILDTRIIKATVDHDVVPEITVQRDSGYCFITASEGADRRSLRVYVDAAHLRID